MYIAPSATLHRYGSQMCKSYTWTDGVDKMFYKRSLQKGIRNLHSSK